MRSAIRTSGNEEIKEWQNLVSWVVSSNNMKNFVIRENFAQELLIQFIYLLFRQPNHALSLRLWFRNDRCRLLLWNLVHAHSYHMMVKWIWMVNEHAELIDHHHPLRRCYLRLIYIHIHGRRSDLHHSFSALTTTNSILILLGRLVHLRLLDRRIIFNNFWSLIDRSRLLLYCRCCFLVQQRLCLTCNDESWLLVYHNICSLREYLCRLLLLRDFIAHDFLGSKFRSLRDASSGSLL